MTIRAAIFTVNFVALTCISGPTFGAQPTLHDVEQKKNVQLPNDPDGPFTHITKARRFAVRLPRDGDRKWKLTIAHVSTKDHGCRTIRIVDSKGEQYTIKPNGSDGVWTLWTTIDIGQDEADSIDIDHTPSAINMFTFSH